MTTDRARRGSATLLLVDDDRIAVKAVQRTMGALGIANPVVVAGDGIEALAHLHDALDPGTGVLPPYIVLLDLNMPRMDGHEFLQSVREDPRLARLVVFVVTTSDAPGDILAAHDRNVAGYLVKEDPLDSLREGLTMIGAYARLVALP